MSDEITINIKGPSELKLSLTVPLTLLTSELKTKIEEQTQIEPERQRLIYSGKVLKDEEPLSTYKVQNGHSLHLVKGAGKPGSAAAATSSTSTASPSNASAAAQAQARGVPANLNAGLQYANNPLAQLEGANGHGYGGGTFNPFAQMPGFDGQNLNDPNAMANMLNDPEAISQAMSQITPEMMDQIIASNPALRDMGPRVREMMANPMMRQMMSDPAMIRQMMAMQGGGGGGGMGGGSPFGALGGAPSAPNPFLAGLGGANPSTPASATGAPAAGGNMFGGMSPEMMRNLMGMGGGGGGAGGFGGFGGGGFGGAAAAPAQQEALPQDTRSLEDRFSNQLRSLNEMGLVDPQQNLRALSMTGGNVEAAIELIFSGRVPTSS